MRKRLALLVVATTSLVTLAFLIPLALLVQMVAEYRAVSAATLRAESLVSVVAASDRSTVGLTVDQVSAGNGAEVTVFWSDGTQAGPARPNAAVELGLAGRSFSVDTANGRQVLVSVQGAPDGPALIAAFVTDHDLHRGVLHAWLILTGLGLLLIGAGVLVADRLAHSMVRPITELSRVSLRLSRGDLSARATPAGPSEIRDVATALNHLAERIRQLLREERESAADLSHRLRTPLTALRLDAEALPAGPDGDRIRDDVDRLERAVSRVIAETRRPDEPAAGCEAGRIVRTRLDFWSALAEDTDRRMSVDLPDAPITVALPADELEAAVDALLGNVFAHTPDGTAFAVKLRRDTSGVRLEVSDDGPGFATDPDALLDRGTGGKGSSGLGLDIARSAAVRVGGELQLGSSPTGGAQVTLTFPIPEQVSASSNPPPLGPTG
ncbi:HAMP domain-containing histidine kinase [Microlunatus elymi]|uniref:Signal transduction histidine-protein kinase/phosphatase MprB n=1 Tax=Microlunatus elymi TaxID=2596828 RepID=A0A516PXS2_9ACTN|nr:HAMP domain-containing sensor histidine kinase [Microlunatus elymi]QDP95966.1 HAMP domain-containing histidine kinase [Microlunatus elymi]